jgi:hypothetical protein
MIHDAKCNIVIDPPSMGALQLRMAGQAEPSIPTDAEILEVFPAWSHQRLIFIARCVREEGRELNTLTQKDIFRYGMKFVLTEAKKLM